MKYDFPNNVQIFSNLKKIYPSLTTSISKYDISVLLATTRLVGMVCPGQNSLYFELQLHKNLRNNANSLIWNVENYDKRIGLIDINISSVSLAGNIKTFLRPKPHQQDNCATIKSIVKPNEFAHQRALIIGGSRGLGEITSKLIEEVHRCILIIKRQRVIFTEFYLKISIF